MTMSVGFATLLAGATPFQAQNVNETYRAQILLDDGTTSPAMVKDLDIRQLTNEVIGSTLARALGLPTPLAYLAVARQDVLSPTRAPIMPDGNRLVFASADTKIPSVTFRFYANPQSAPSLYAALSHWKELGHCYAFDTWIANTDRHMGNLLFGGSKEVWLIDHGHAFTGPVWTTANLVPEGEFRHRLGEWLTPHLSSDDRSARAKEASASEFPIRHLDIDSLVTASLIDRILPASEITALRSFSAIGASMWHTILTKLWALQFSYDGHFA
jgi:hypothetical protein